MGLGVTGLANALEAMGHPYGTPEFLRVTEKIMQLLVSTAYDTSVELAKEKGPFPLFDADKYLESEFVKLRLSPELQEKIRKYGIRNSHLISIAPTGTVSLCADNVSSSIEPVFSYMSKRLVRHDDGEKEVVLSDYGYNFLGVKGKTCEQVSVLEHLTVLSIVQKWTDASVSKTCNVGDNVGWEGFKEIYMGAWRMGCKGCTTFRLSGKRKGIMQGISACEIDPNTGRKTCVE